MKGRGSADCGGRMGGRCRAYVAEEYSFTHDTNDDDLYDDDDISDGIYLFNGRIS